MRSNVMEHSRRTRQESATRAADAVMDGDDQGTSTDLELLRIGEVMDEGVINQVSRALGAYPMA